jgi:hypothetical protein
MCFDYSAPAELFLAKPMKSSRTKYWRFSTAAEALVTPLRICEGPSALENSAFLRGPPDF